MKHAATFLAILCFHGASGQDLHFSQFNENPALVNPALSGALGPLRVSAAYKDQWRSVATPYQTYGVSIDKRFELSGDGFSARRRGGGMGAGLAIYNDRAGDASFGQTRASLSLSGFVPLNKKGWLSGGLQAGIVQRRLDQGKLIFPDQYNGVVHDPNLSSGEDLSGQSFIYPDIAAGFLWCYAQDETRSALNDRVKANLGVSMFRINTPAAKFLMGGVSDFRRKVVLHGDFLFARAQTDVAFAPSFLLQFQGTSREIVAGTFVNCYLGANSRYTGIVKRKSLNVGVFYRNSDAVIMAFVFEREDTYAAGLSYDVNLSTLNTASYGRGGIEITLRYMVGRDPLRPVARY